MFGGLQGLEAGVDADANLEVTDPSLLFDFYLNTCPSQGSRTIRTEVGQVAHGAAGVVPVHTEQPQSSAAFLPLAATRTASVIPPAMPQTAPGLPGGPLPRTAVLSAARVCFRKRC